MLTLFIAIVVFIVLWFLSHILRNKKGYRVYLILYMVVSVVIACICFEFFSTGCTDCWVDELAEKIFFATPMGCLFLLDNSKTRKQNEK